LGLVRTDFGDPRGCLVVASVNDHKFSPAKRPISHGVCRFHGGDDVQARVARHDRFESLTVQAAARYDSDSNGALVNYPLAPPPVDHERNDSKPQMTGGDSPSIEGLRARRGGRFRDTRGEMARQLSGWLAAP
jgi:hypothetical protein